MTEQADFWRGKFGDEYISRNESDLLLASNLVFFSRIFESSAETPESFLELGANVGMNIRALKLLFPQSKFTGIEINSEAASRLGNIADEVIHGSIEETSIPGNYDFVFTKGVLIHLNPESLPATYEKMFKASSNWILIAEYYNPSPIQIEYRGHTNKLFKRDFAGEMMERFPELKLHSYGFSYHSGIFPQDDISWFLLKKSGTA
jgi:spore coat polysaccharide biosynthesis protein SpsF